MDLKKIWDKANSLHGCLSNLKTNTSRRRYPLDEDPLYMKNIFISDEAKILSSKMFRIQRDKTQVFSFPESPLIRTRLAHVLEVVACSVVDSDILGRNTDLVSAAALGHDIGHVPFGHQGFAVRIKRVQAHLPNTSNAAENVAYHYKTAKIVVDGWMQSPGHRRNILGDYESKSYTSRMGLEA